MCAITLHADVRQGTGMLGYAIPSAWRRFMLRSSASTHRMLPRLFAALMVGTALSCGSAALAPARAQTVTVEKLTFGPKEMAVTVPKIEVDGSSLTQGELTTLFQFTDIKSIADLLGRFNAKSVRLPEIRIEQNLSK